MIETISNEWRTARKPHKCCLCNQTIEPKERYNHQVNKFDGDVYTFDEHEKCNFIAGEIWDFCDPDEGMNDDDFYEGCVDLIRTFICPDCEKYEDEADCDNMDCLDKLYDLLQKYELYRERHKDYWMAWKLRERKAKGE